MILIVGGAGQGKMQFAQERFCLKREDFANGADCSISDVLQARAIDQFHLLVRRLGEDALPFTEQICRERSDIIILLDEIGCGIIPLEKNDRIWRETVGRCGCMLAAEAETVIRVVCGIPTVIKGELP